MSTPDFILRMRSEERANHAVQLCGLTTALAGSVFLIESSAQLPSTRLFVCVVLYSVGLVVMLASSTLYHLLRDSPNAELYQCLDHAGIFLMIAGTYSPISLGVIGGPLGFCLFGAVWIGAMGGIILRIYWPAVFLRVSLGLYLFLGWLILPALPGLLDRMPGEGVALIVAGGIVYTMGVPFYRSARLRYGTAIWHAFVVVAAALHFAAILRDIVWPVA